MSDINKARSIVARLKAQSDDPKWQKYLAVYSRMLERRKPGLGPFMDAVDDPWAKTGKRDYVTAFIDALQGSESNLRGSDREQRDHSTGPGKVYGNYVPNERVGVYYPISLQKFQRMESKRPGYAAGLIHDTDLYKGTMSDYDYFRNGGHMHKADWNFYYGPWSHPNPIIARGPLAGHGFYWSTDPYGRPNPTSDGEEFKDGDEFLNLEFSDDESSEVPTVLDSGSEVPTVLDEDYFSLDVTQDHNFGDLGSSVRMKEFQDTKKLATVDCGLGRSDALMSPLKTFLNRFSAKRTIQTNWHHSGSSSLNKRETFTYVFRHCLTRPPDEAVLSPESNEIVKSGPGGTAVKLKSAELPLIRDGVNPLVESGDYSNTTDQRTWYSPYCLKELETVSWNINNFKLKPVVLGLYDNDNDILPGAVDKDQVLGNEDHSLANGKSVLPDKTITGDAVNSFECFANKHYTPKREYSGLDNQDSVVRQQGLIYKSVPSISMPQTDGTTKNVSAPEYGDFNVQLGRGHLYFTFVNTGDTTMIVDAVVHRGKEKHVAIPFGTSDYPESLTAAVNTPDVNGAICKPYEINYMAYHLKNTDRKVSDYVRQADDVRVNPEVKFLPTSYRTPAVTVPTTAVDGTGKNLGQPKRQWQHIATSDDPVTSADSNADLGTHSITTVANVNFVDIQRKRIVVGPNSRKTLHMVMPSDRYDPTDSLYNGVFNDHGFAVTFGVTGKTSKVVIPSTTKGEAVQKSAQFVGRTAASTSFHIFGSESQTIYPVYLKEKRDLASQINRLADPQLVSPTEAYHDGIQYLQEAAYIGAAGRTIEGRYAYLLTDGEPTKKQLKTGETTRRLEEISGSAGADSLTANNIRLYPNSAVTNSNVVPNSGSSSLGNHTFSDFWTSGSSGWPWKLESTAADGTVTVGPDLTEALLKTAMASLLNVIHISAQPSSHVDLSFRNQANNLFVLRLVRGTNYELIQ